MDNPKDYASIARQVRRQVLTMIHKAGTSHIASNFSATDLAVVLYENLKVDDSVVWSKGWCAALIYTMLARHGVIPESDLAKFPNYPYIGLAEPSVPGVHVAGGSMGHGLPVAVGMALGNKRAGHAGLVYCIMSDGEMNEGTTWESAALAAHHKLDNLVVFIDVNKWQAMGKTEDVVDFEDINQKWGAFNWTPYRINGHAHGEIESAILQGEHKKGPMVIICDTIKGKGVSFFEDHLLYHYKHVDVDEYKRAMEELA